MIFTKNIINRQQKKCCNWKKRTKQNKIKSISQVVKYNIDGRDWEKFKFYDYLALQLFNRLVNNSRVGNISAPITIKFLQKSTNTYYRILHLHVIMVPASSVKLINKFAGRALGTVIKRICSPTTVNMIPNTWKKVKI